MIKRFSLWHSFQIQWRVVKALIRREILTRYGRHNIGFLWLFVEPMSFILVITGLWNATKGAHGFKLPITAFAVTGYSSVLLWRNMVSRCSGAMTPNIGLLYHRNVRVLDVFAARILLELAGATISFVIISILFITLGWMDPPEDILKVIYGWSMLAWFGASLALVVGALAEMSEFVDKIWHPLAFLLMPLSGLAFMVDWLSKDVQGAFLMFPMVHGLELLREGYFGLSVHPHYDMGFMTIVCLCLTLMGLLFAKIAARRMTPS